MIKAVPRKHFGWRGDGYNTYEKINKMWTVSIIVYLFGITLYNNIVYAFKRIFINMI